MRNIFTETFNDCEVTSDGRTVWVNHKTYGCVARFYQTGQEHLLSARPKERRETLNAPPEGPNLNDWRLFVKRTRDFFDVTITEKHRPLYLMPN